MNSTSDQPTPRTVINTLLLTDLVGSTKLVDELGDARVAEVFARGDRLARDLLREHDGREIDKTDGYLFLFDRPIDAVLYALAYHDRLRGLSEELDVPLTARAGIHLGEVIIFENTPEDVSRGAKPLEVEGLSKPLAARIMSLAQGGQTLMTRGAFDLARRAVVGSEAAPADTAWMAHGPYLVKGHDEPIEVFEVGVEGAAPLSAPPDTEKARRSVAAGDEETLGWRPGAGLDVPQRPGWILDHKIGEGGFGEVWLAEQRQTRDRRVFKFCFDAARLRTLKRELTLFRLLRDALGDRDDIAQLYEVQLEEPPFFLESEYSPRGSLVDWATKLGGIDRVPVEVRLDLVARTARAVASAHSVGIVHKDVKPGNILIYEDTDGNPRPRLSDFGIGALTEEGKLGEHNITIAGFSGAVTELGTTTQMYAPPESLAGKPVTVLGDVYALGIVLYQMVVGDLDRPLATGWERDVADPVLREDIAVCVEGDERQRLGSAQGLAKRLEVLPERRRARRRRQRTRVALVGVSALAVLGVVAVVWGLREMGLREQAEIQREQAVIERDKAERQLEIWLLGLSAPNPWDYGYRTDVTVVDVLDTFVDVMGDLEDQPEVKAALLHAIGTTYRSLNEIDAASDTLAEALALRRTHLVAPDEDLAESIDEWGQLLEDRQKGDDRLDAETYYEEALAMRQELADASGGDSQARLRIAETTQHLAALLNKSGRSEEAQPLYEKALAIRQELLPGDHRDVGRSLNNLGFCMLQQGRYAEAELSFRAALPIFQKLHADEPHLEVAGAMGNLGRCLMEQVPDEPDAAALVRLEEARTLLEQAVLLKQRVFQVQPARLARELHTTAKLIAHAADLPGADRLAVDLHGIADNLTDAETFPADHPSLAVSLHYYGQLLFRAGEPEAAEQALESAFAMRRRVHDARAPESQTLLAECLLRLDRPGDAEPHLLECYEILTRAGPSSARRGQLDHVLDMLIDVSERLDKTTDAERYREERREVPTPGQTSSQTPSQPQPDG